VKQSVGKPAAYTVAASDPFSAFDSISGALPVVASNASLYQSSHSSTGGLLDLDDAFGAPPLLA
jgi:hypothetical protein